MSEDWHDEVALEDGQEQVFRLSASAVKTHKNCPKQFELSYIKEKPETKEFDGYGEVGSAVHEAIEHFLGTNSSPPRYQNQTRQALVSKFQEIDPDVKDDIWERGMNCLETAGKYLSHSDFAGEWTFQDLEKRVFYTLGRPDIQAGFKGYMDAVADDGDGNRIIVDWKSGSIREEGEVIQGATYMKGHQEEYGFPPDKILFVYLKEGKERVIEPNDETWQTFVNKASSVIEDIRRDEFEAKPGDPCYWCGQEMWCDATPAGAGGISYEKFRNRQIEF